MKMRQAINLFIVISIVCFFIFWLERFSVFDDHVSLRYEDWARGAITQDDEPLPTSARVWLNVALLSTGIALTLALIHTIRNFDRK